MAFDFNDYNQMYTPQFQQNQNQIRQDNFGGDQNAMNQWINSSVGNTRDGRAINSWGGGGDGGHDYTEMRKIQADAAAGVANYHPSTLLAQNNGPWARFNAMRQPQAGAGVSGQMSGGGQQGGYNGPGGTNMTPGTAGLAGLYGKQGDYTTGQGMSGGFGNYADSLKQQFAQNPTAAYSRFAYGNGGAGQQNQGAVRDALFGGDQNAMNKWINDTEYSNDLKSLRNDPATYAAAMQFGGNPASGSGFTTGQGMGGGQVLGAGSGNINQPTSWAHEKGYYGPNVGKPGNEYMDFDPPEMPQTTTPWSQPMQAPNRGNMRFRTNQRRPYSATSPMLMQMYRQRGMGGTGF